LQALLQVLHPFIKEVAFHLAACFWWRHLKYLGYKDNRQDPGRVVTVQPVTPFPLVLATDGRGKLQDRDACSHWISPQ
jgi:hypothetical protein